MLTLGFLFLLVVKLTVGKNWFSDAEHYWNMESIWYDKIHEPYRSSKAENGVHANRWSGTVRGNVEVTPSVGGIGVNLDGRTGWIDFGSRYKSCYVDVNFCPNGMSVALWVRVNKMAEHNTSVILSFGRGDSGLTVAYTKYGKLELSIISGLLGQTWRLTTSDNTIEPGVWYHLLSTWNISNGMSLFINGTRLSNASIYKDHFSSNKTCQASDDCSIDWQMTLGKSFSPSSYSAIDVDELSLWSTVVNDDTIRQAAGDIKVLYRSNGGCSSGWHSHLQSCYRIVPSPYSWEKGQVACEQEHSNLASIGSEDELQSLEKNIQRMGVSSCLYIGLRQQQFNGSYSWVDDNVGTLPRPIVKNDTTNTSNCVQRMPDGTWAAGSCGLLCGFICKKQRDYILRNADFYCRAKRRDMAIVQRRVRIRLVESELECAIECLMYGTHCRSYNFQYTDNYPNLLVSGDHLWEETGYEVGSTSCHTNIKQDYESRCPIRKWSHDAWKSVLSNEDPYVYSFKPNGSTICSFMSFE